MIGAKNNISDRKLEIPFEERYNGDRKERRVMLGWIIFAVFAVMGVFFWTGKGGWLIAGYNTASAEEKKKYDEKKLNRTMAKGWTIITAGLLFLNLSGEDAAPVFLTVFVILVFIGIGYILLMANNCYVTTERMTAAEAEKIAREKRNGRRISIVVLVVLVVLAGVPMFAGNVETKFDGEKIRLSGFLVPGYTLERKEIVSVEYETDLDLGKRINGNGSVRIQAGQFRNEKFGDYRLYSYNTCSEYIVIGTKERTIVVNDKTPEKTEALYKKVKRFSER